MRITRELYFRTPVHYIRRFSIPNLISEFLTKFYVNNEKFVENIMERFISKLFYTNFAYTFHKQFIPHV